ncbi:hypothetical protein SBRY_50097 [Actinacidiphila bryophytorum]|uniref:Uncharacterized protein n=1 Tax=Actinacidiphila bryophytorum TaxID=1436133 RepID=A0A9W4MJ08_9ACTN|nr:hypothetical protein SBRY_50097 [Actinacidiphila bryophytorum]
MEITDLAVTDFDDSPHPVRAERHVGCDEPASQALYPGPDVVKVRHQSTLERAVRVRREQSGFAIQPPHAHFSRNGLQFRERLKAAQNDSTSKELLLQFYEALHYPCKPRPVSEIGNEARLLPFVLAGFDVVLHDS